MKATDDLGKDDWEMGIENTVETRKLQDRWRTKAGKKLLERIIKSFPKEEERAIDELVGRIDGKYDLRGLPLKATPTKTFDVMLRKTIYEVTMGALEFNSFRLRCADFDFSEFDGVSFSKCQFEDSTFRHTRFSNCKRFASKLIRTSFAHAEILDSSLGSYVDADITEYRDCDFSCSRTRRCSTTYSLFENCMFDDVVMDDVDFRGSKLVDCNFSGCLQAVVFSGRASPHDRLDPHLPPEQLRSPAIRNVDFSRCKALGLSFAVEVDLNQVSLPPESDHLYVWYPRRTYSRARKMAEREGSNIRARGPTGATLSEAFGFCLAGGFDRPEELLEILSRKDVVKGDDETFARRYVEIVEECSRIEAPGKEIKQKFGI